MKDLFMGDKPAFEKAYDENTIYWKDPIHKETLRNFVSYYENCKASTDIATLQTLLNQAAGVLTTCDEAMGYMSEYDIPLCLPDDVKQALAAIEPYIIKGGE